MKKSVIFVTIALGFFNQSCGQNTNDSSEINAISATRVQDAAKSLLKDIGIDGYLNERHNEHSWSHKSVPAKKVLPQLEKWSREIGMSGKLPPNNVCAALANVIRKRAGYKVYGGGMPGFIPSIVDDLLRKGGYLVKASNAENGDFATSGDHMGVVVQISTGERKVLAFTGFSSGDLDAQIVPMYDSYEYYRTNN